MPAKQLTPFFNPSGLVRTDWASVLGHIGGLIPKIREPAEFCCKSYDPIVSTPFYFIFQNSTFGDIQTGGKGFTGR